MNPHHRLLLAATLLAAAVTARAAEPAPAPAKAPAKTSAARPVENAPENFPLTLRGFFGKGEKVEVSVQDKTSGKSVWISPGSAHTGWKLESADAATGRAVFSQGTRRVNLFRAVESPATPAEVTEADVPKLKSAAESVVFKKIEELMKDPQCKALADSLSDESDAALKISHPEYIHANGGVDQNKPGAIVAKVAEMKRLLLARNSPEAELLKPVIIPAYDALIQVPPPVGKARESMTHEEYQLRTFQLADELYRQRNAAK